MARLTVAELIRKLQEQPQDAMVMGFVEGCGCCETGDTHDIADVTMTYNPTRYTYQQSTGRSEWGEWRTIHPDNVKSLYGSTNYADGKVEIREMAEPVLRDFPDLAGNEVWFYHETRQYKPILEDVQSDPYVEVRFES